MCITTKDGVWIASAYDAREFLEGHGLDKFDIEELGGMIQPAEYVDLEYELECLRSEFKSYEASLDAAQGVLNDVLNLCMELKERQRSATAQRALQAVYDLVYKSEAI